ncbi:MAG: MBL fold metallo-hydrolase [Candidatus Aminicenantes bacterium]|nr:MBL fold metallo-hydrolase [Candidatus Aminicenantes bacterium]
MKIKFLGATRQVTGSCYLLEAGGLKILVECGMFQERKYLSRNWNPFAVYPGLVDHALLTHCHLDHSGLIPKLVKEGFEGNIFMTSASRDLLEIMLLDSAKIQQEDAEYKKKRHQKEGRKGPHPEIPLYRVRDARNSFRSLSSVAYQTALSLNDQVSVVFHDAGHIVGSAMAEVKVKENGKTHKVIFSGDIGNWNKPIVKDPSVFQQADYVVMESTYGDRQHHESEHPEVQISEIINKTYSAGGKVIIPTFAVERAQDLLFYLSKLVRTNEIPFLKIFLDSPMAVRVTDVFQKHTECFDQQTLKLIEKNESPFQFPGLKLVRTREQSKAINEIQGPCIIMAGSGMCTGGRIKHHLVHNISKPENTVLFVGYQAQGTLGRHIVNGEKQVRIHGRYWDVRANIVYMDSLSAHADSNDLVRWIGELDSPPKNIFLTHGEEKAALSLQKEIEKKGWPVVVPKYKQEFLLDNS